MAAAIEVEKLTRVYGRGPRRVVALDNLSLRIEQGTVHGLLGPNGAGKTTLVKVLSTVLLPTSGTARVMGYDVVRDTDRVRPIIGIVFGGERGLYWRLTGRQNLVYWAALYRVPESQARRRAQELLERVGLSARADDRVEAYSRGMKQRLHLARGLIADPRVLFLDEPTTGMDPIAAREFRTLIRELRQEGRTILLTTHDMVEAEALCDRVALIDRGRLLAEESPRTLATWIATYERIDVEGAPEELLVSIRTLPGVGTVVPISDGRVRIETVAEGAAARVLQRLVAAGVIAIATSLPSLEEVYIHLLGERGLRV
jgi:ABC-2 type transport system ATP-binding protein